MIKRCKEEIEIEIDKYIADIFWLIKFYLYNILPLNIKIRINKFNERFCIINKVGRIKKIIKGSWLINIA